MGVPLLGFLIFFSQMWYWDLQLERHGRETIAVIDRVDPTSRTPLAFHYTVSGRAYSAASTAGDIVGDVRRVAVGDTVRITYLPSNPAVAQAGHAPRGVLAGMGQFLLVAPLGAAAFYLIPIYLLPLRRLRRKRAVNTAR